MTHIYANAGDVIPDRSGVEYAKVKRDMSVHQASMPSLNDFEFAGRAPQVGERMPDFMAEWIDARRTSALDAMGALVPVFKKWDVV